MHMYQFRGIYMCVYVYVYVYIFGHTYFSNIFFFCLSYVKTKENRRDFHTSNLQTVQIVLSINLKIKFFSNYIWSNFCNVPIS